MLVEELLLSEELLLLLLKEDVVVEVGHVVLLEGREGALETKKERREGGRRAGSSASSMGSKGASPRTRVDFHERFEPGDRRSHIHSAEVDRIHWSRLGQANPDRTEVWRRRRRRRNEVSSTSFELSYNFS